MSPQDGPHSTALVIGAGAAGLGAAGALQRAGVPVTVLERTSTVAASWRSRYEGLRLNTPGWMSGMPGYRAKVRTYGEFPTRDAWVRYLEDYAAALRLRVEHDVTVQRIDRTSGRWSLATGRGSRLADFVVVATGFNLQPHLPRWPGLEDYRGSIVHAADFRTVEPYRGRDVLVVGPNVSGVEISSMLVDGGAARVRVAIRTPPNLVTRKFLGVSINLIGMLLQPFPPWVADQVSWYSMRLKLGRLDRYGLPRSPQGVGTAIAKQLRAPAYDDGFVEHLKAGRIELVPAVTGFGPNDVVLADGQRIRPDAVIAATGYRPGLEPLVGHLGLLDDAGRPVVTAGDEDPAAPGLFFAGYRGNLTGMLRMMRLDALSIARTVRERTAA